MSVLRFCRSIQHKSLQALFLNSIVSHGFKVKIRMISECVNKIEKEEFLK